MFGELKGGENKSPNISSSKANVKSAFKIMNKAASTGNNIREIDDPSQEMTQIDNKEYGNYEQVAQLSAVNLVRSNQPTQEDQDA